jgi:hypothetical protein
MAAVVKLADTTDLKSVGIQYRESSILSGGTIRKESEYELDSS